MARVVVVGGGFAGLSSAARLAKLHHEVTLLEAGDELGGRLRSHVVDGHAWQLSPDTVTLPGVLRDLFHQSGRPIEKVLDLIATDGRRHVFADRSVLDLPMGHRSDQHDAITEAFGDDEWSPWVDGLADTWDVLRRTVLEQVLDDRDQIDRSVRSTLEPRRSLEKLARTRFKDDRLRSMARDQIRLDGQRLANTPGFLAVENYVERSFGRWRVDGGLPALADALRQRLDERGVVVHTGTTAHELMIDAGAVAGVVTDTGDVAADVVVWCAPTWPAPLSRQRGLPAIPAARTLLLLDEDAPALRLDVVVHGNPALRMWGDGAGHWTVAHNNAEDTLIALRRAGIKLDDHVLQRHELSPTDLVRLGHWGWAWQGWTTLFDRPGVGQEQRLGGTLYFAGAHAHPGGTIEDIGMATAAIAEAVGAAPRR